MGTAETGHVYALSSHSDALNLVGVLLATILSQFPVLKFSPYKALKCAMLAQAFTLPQAWNFLRTSSSQVRNFIIFHF